MIDFHAIVPYPLFLTKNGTRRQMPDFTPKKPFRDFNKKIFVGKKFSVGYPLPDESEIFH